MSTIVFAMFTARGHLYGSFGLAQKLKSRNHRIIYMGNPDKEDLIKSKGFEFLPIFEEIDRKRSSNGAPDESQNLQIQRQKNKEFMEYLFSTELDQLLQDISADIMIIDSFLPFLGLCAYRNRIKSVLLSVTLQERDQHVPPLNTTIIPQSSTFSKLKIRLNWKLILLNFFLRKSFLRVLGIDVDFIKLLENLATEAGYPNNKANPYSTLMPGINMPELILCPVDFEFPRSVPPFMRYMETCIPPEEDIIFPWGKIEQDKKLVFCSLGSQPTDYPTHQKFYQTVIDTIGKRPNWQLVISIGKENRIDTFSNPYPNVVLVNWAPYRKLLKKAAIMINHGGLGSIKQSIYYGVPMIVIPFGREQFGNAARVAYHGIGLMGNLLNLSEEYFNEMIDKIDSDPSIKRQTELMGEKFQRLENSGNCVKLIESMSNSSFESLLRVFSEEFD